MKLMKNYKILSMVTALLLMAVLGTFMALGGTAAGELACAEEGCGGAYTNGFCSADETHYQPATLNAESGCYEIGNAGQLYWFAKQVNEKNGEFRNANAVLTAHITVNNTTVSGPANGLRLWAPIGFDQAAVYSGHFDGQGYTISGLYAMQEQDDYHYVGLFGYLANGAVVENVSIVNFYFRDVNSCIGSVAGRMSGGTIRNVYAQGSIYGRDIVSSVGGLVGATSSQNNVIEGCLVNVSLRVTTDPDEFSIITPDPGIYTGAFVATGRGTITNSFYVTNAYNGVVGSDCTLNNSRGVALAELTDGVIAHALGTAWGQNIDNGNATEALPVLGGAVVYYGYSDCDSNDLHYSNTKLNPTQGHSITYVALDHEIAYACAYCGHEEDATKRLTLIAPADLTYNGSAKEASLTCELPKCDHVHEISYCCAEGCVFPGAHTATVTVGGATASLTFEIAASTLFPEFVTVSITTPQDDLYYRGEAGVKPALSVKRDGVELTLDTDYTVHYTNNVNVTQHARATVVLNIPGYQGATKTVEFEILPFNLNHVHYRYPNGESTPGVLSVTYGDPMWTTLPFNLVTYTTGTPSFTEEYTLVAGEDFVWEMTEEEYKKLSEGGHDIVLKGIGNFTGTDTFRLNIERASLNDAERFTVEWIRQTYYYSGVTIVPEVMIYDKLCGAYLRLGVDYLLPTSYPMVTQDYAVVASALMDSNYSGNLTLGTIDILPRSIAPTVSTTELILNLDPEEAFTDQTYLNLLNPSLTLVGSDEMNGTFICEYRVKGAETFTSTVPTAPGEYELRVCLGGSISNESCYDVNPSAIVSLTIPKIKVNVSIADLVREEDVAFMPNQADYSYQFQNDEYNGVYTLVLMLSLNENGHDIDVAYNGFLKGQELYSHIKSEWFELVIVKAGGYHTAGDWLELEGEHMHARPCTVEGCDYVQTEAHKECTFTTDTENLTISAVCGICDGDAGSVKLILPEDTVYNGQSHDATLQGEIYGANVTISYNISDRINATRGIEAVVTVIETGTDNFATVAGMYDIVPATLTVTIDPIIVEQYSKEELTYTWSVAGLVEGDIIADVEFRVYSYNPDVVGERGTVQLFGIYFEEEISYINYTYTSISVPITVVAHTEHRDFVGGICSICHKGYETPATDEEGTYLIANAGHLYWLAVNATDSENPINAKLVNDITINEGYLFSYNEEGEPVVTASADGRVLEDLSALYVWSPIPTFYGTLDGNGYAIIGLYSPRMWNDTALFTELAEGSTLKDLTLKNSFMGGWSNTAGFVSANYGTISNCHNEAVVSGGTTYAGGIVAINYGIVTGCSNTGTVFCSNSTVGGIVGDHMGGRVKNCFNSGTVIGTGYVGGIVGRLYVRSSDMDVVIAGCYNSGEVGLLAEDDGSYVGGIVSYNMGFVTDCYNTASMSIISVADFGGIVGINMGTLEYCYNSGDVSGHGLCGSIVGNNDGTINNCYYLDSTAGFGVADEADREGAWEAVSAERLASGEIAFLLDEDRGDHVWKQTLGTDATPNFDGAVVYKTLACDGVSPLYANTAIEGQDHADEDEDDICDNCETVLHVHVDADRDHACDECGKPSSRHADENDDHFCDFCQMRLTEHSDADGDHLCDLCDKKAHVDADFDHTCDECGEEASQHVDGNKDHVCDICAITMSLHYDEEGDHICDHCNEAAHTDHNNDHICDLCEESASAHDDGDGDHLCDICGEICHYDGDPDHLCDLCGVMIFDHIDDDADHACDVCRADVHADVNSDHLCDVCEEPSSEHTDEAPVDHYCDLCNEYYYDHVDEDDDHLCDACGETVHTDGDFNHLCDACGEPLSDHTDEDPADHYCDWCTAFLDNHVDEDHDHLCEVCGEWVFDETDEDGDHLCDHCGDILHSDADGDELCDVCGISTHAHYDVDEDHVCDTCGETCSDHYDEDGDRLCDLCGDDFHEHADEDDDHLCDNCANPVSEHGDEDGDHHCDVCGEELSSHYDGDGDHLCDICEETLSEHVDWDYNHICDTCSVTVSDHKDENRNHDCDICRETISEHTPGDWITHDSAHWKRCTYCEGFLTDIENHVDENIDHACDICEATYSLCGIDDDRDHACDYCGVVADECYDSDFDGFCDVCSEHDNVECINNTLDHLCDICAAEVSEHADDNSDHYCEQCYEMISEHSDEDSDHYCDLCGNRNSEHLDADNNHDCDHCGEWLSNHEDTNNDHLCNLCGETVSEHTDADNNHHCDVCRAELASHTDYDGDHICDSCGETLTSHVDHNSDHYCDLCGSDLSTHADEDDDHHCDLCGEEMTFHGDYTNDHLCDVCGETVSDHVNEDRNHECDLCGETVSEHVDEDRNHECDLCGATSSRHADADSDHYCDLCGMQVSESETKPTESETAPVEPETKPTESETAPVEPETKPTESETDPVEPETAPVEPETKPAESETDPAEPETKPAEGETQAPATPVDTEEPQKSGCKAALGEGMILLTLLVALGGFCLCKRPRPCLRARKENP